MTLLPETPNDLLTGTVLRASGSLYEVDAPPQEFVDAANNAARREFLLCSLSGRLKKGARLSSQPVSVGDQVRVRALDSFGPDARGRRLREGFIEEVLPRHSALARARYRKSAQVSVANLDQVVIVMSLREPEFHAHRLDRFLILAEAADLRPIVCLNKLDLLKKRARKAEVEPVVKLYEGIGYRVLPVSAETDEGLEEVRHELKGHISAVLGSSGVGKSSLINAVQPGLHLWVGDVMEMGKGRHTTTEVSLHPLDEGGYIADTPGIKTVSLLEGHEVNLPECFPEFPAFSPQCRFNNCEHAHEPGCAVRAAVESKALNAGRYDSYLKMREDLKSQKTLFNRQLLEAH